MEQTASRRTVAQWALATGALIGLVVVAAMSWPQALAATEGLQDARPLLVAVAVGAQALAVGAAAVTYRVAARANGAELDSRAALEAALGASALSRMLPAGGAVGVWYATRRLRSAGLDRVPAATAAVLVSVATVAVLPLVVVAGAGAAAAQGAVVWAPALGSAVVAAVIVAGLGVAVTVIRRQGGRGLCPEGAGAVPGGLASRVASWVLARTGLGRDELGSVLSVAHRRGAVLTLGGAAARYWLLDAAVLWLIFAAFGVTLHPGLVVLGTGAANLATALPVTPGGLGLAEAGMGAAFVSLGVPTGLAVTVVLAYRLLSLWLPALVALAVCRPPAAVTA